MVQGNVRNIRSQTGLKIAEHNLFCICVCVCVCELSLRPKTSHRTRRLRDCSVAQADTARRESTARAGSNFSYSKFTLSVQTRL